MSLRHDFVGRRSLCGQILVQPVEGRHDRSRLVTKPLHELHREVAVERSKPERSQNIFHAFRGLIAEAQKAVR